MKRIPAAAVIILCAAVSATSVNGQKASRDYLISGQNTLQRIHYETSSSFSTTHTARMAMDSDYETAWVSQNSRVPHWLTIDFGIKRLMTSMKITLGRKDNQNTVKKFALQFFYKGEWFDFKKVDCEYVEKRKLKYSRTAEIDLVGVDASIFRIWIPEDGTFSGWAAISEIEVFLGAARIKYYDERLKSLALPIKNGFLPTSDYGYPNAQRKYRGGRHVGLDISYYHDDDSYDPKPVTRETPVLASGPGKVIRADWDYKKLTPAEWVRQSEYYQNNPHTFDARSFGGIQVWIDHGNGIVTAYNHLSKIESHIKVGKDVKRGEIIGRVGNSGLRGDSEGKDYGLHLHYEIWIDAYYLGYGMSPEEVKNYVKWIFFQTQ
jgi:murein DD-endopeptidase MepM/ murein hydrolase activator NlpD